MFLSRQALELLGGLRRNIRSDQVVFPLHFEPLKSSWRRACSRAGISNLGFMTEGPENAPEIYSPQGGGVCAEVGLAVSSIPSHIPKIH